MFWSIPAPGIRLAALRCGLLLIAALSCLAGGETRFHQYTRQFAEPAAPARPVAAGYLGGSGDEVLSGGVFLADGSLVLAGTAWGPRFDPAGIQVAVLGSDGAAPSFTMPTVKAKDGSMAINPPDWSQRSGAGFLVRLGADHRSVVRAVRLPWGSGSITSVATDADGSVYVAGLCGSGFAAVGRAMALAAPGITDPDDIFVLRLDQDLRSVAWAVTLKDSAGAAPRVSVLDGGVVSVVGKNAFHLGTDGTLHKATAIALTKNWVRGVDSRTHAFATGGDSLTRTGWEPWRRPMLFLYDSAGRHMDAFYGWGEKLVGTNWSRLVSDSEVRVLAYDQDGTLLVSGWSDGGNSVFEYLPQDLKTSVYAEIERRTGRKTGLGFSTWGANSGSFTHLMRIDPASGELLAKTMYISFHIGQNKPSAVDLDFVGTAADGSVVVAGASGSGLIQTSSLVVNSLDPAKDYIGGRFIAVLNRDLSDLRFASAIPGGGKAPLSRHSGSSHSVTAMGSRRIGNRVLTVVVGGAAQDPAFKPVAPVQSGFGGGSLDGQYVVLDMAAAPPASAASAARPPAPAARPADPGARPDPKDAPPAGSYAVRAGMDRPWSVLVLRDMGGDRWPAIYLAGPEGSGGVTLPSATGSFTLRGSGADVQLSGGGRQDRRLGGELSRIAVTPGKDGATQASTVYPDLGITITLAEPGKCRGRIVFNGRTLELNGTATIRPCRPTGKGVDVSGRFLTTKGALGLGGTDAKVKEHPVEIEFWTPARP